jgi:membrane associated rhomboid family serine protease
MWPEGVRNGQWWRMLTVVFVHVPLTDGLFGLMHVGFNMLITYRLGAQVERQMGSPAFAALYFACAAAGSMFAFFIGPDVAGVGASGAAFGLFGVWLAPAIRRRGTSWGRRIMNELGGVLLLNAAVPFIIEGVAWEAHLGGVLAGLGIGWAWTSKPFVENVVARTAVAVAVLAVSVARTQI